MTDETLFATSPAQGHLPETIGSVTLAEAGTMPIWSVLTYRGKAGAVSEALQSAHGVAFPEPGRVAEAAEARAVWTGLDQCLLFAAQPDATLADHAAITDQSDAWVHLGLSGTGVADVLARLVPIDLSTDAFPPGQTRRTSLGHMAAIVIRDGVDQFEILTFRSMAGTAVHELTRAMRMVAARTAL